MLNILVVVASKHGSTRGIAETIADELRAAQFAVDVQDANDVADLRGYDAVVLGSAVYGGSWLPAAKQFAQQFRAQLAALPVWVFSSGPLGTTNPQPHDDPARLAAPLGRIMIRDHRIFEGKLDPHDLGVAERMIAKVVRSPLGDFRDWDAVRAWAHDIAAALRPASISQNAGG